MRAVTPAHPAPAAVMRAGTPAHLARTAVMRARRPRSRHTYCTPQPSCGRDARAPGARSRHAGATPALPAPAAVMRARRPRTWHAQPSCGHDARAPGARSRHAGGDARAPGTHSRHAGATPAHLHIRAPQAATGMNFGLHFAEAGASCDTANPDRVRWTGSRGGAEICQFESSYLIRVIHSNPR